MYTVNFQSAQNLKRLLEVSTFGIINVSRSTLVVNFLKAFLYFDFFILYSSVEQIHYIYFSLKYYLDVKDLAAYVYTH